MLLVIGKHSSLDIRLQYVLPYVFKMFEDKQSKVKAKAIEVAVGLFEPIFSGRTSSWPTKSGTRSASRASVGWCRWRARWRRR